MDIHAGYSDNPPDHRFRRGADFPLWTMGLLNEGSIRVDLSDGLCRQQAPAMLLIPPHTPYHLSWGGEGDHWRSIALLFDPPPALRRRLRLPTVLGKVMGIALDQAHAPAMAAAFHEVHRVVQGSLPLREALIEQGLGNILLLAASQVAADDGGQDALVAQAAEILGAELERQLTLPELAHELGCSLSTLGHRFSAAMGISPARYRERCRMQAAQFMLLQSARSIQEIAVEVGFDDPFHFSRRFRQHAACSPSAFRRNNGS